jgi:DNA modification methylase
MVSSSESLSGALVMKTIQLLNRPVAGIGHTGSTATSKPPCDYQIRLKSPADLKPNPRNPRTHSKRKITDLAAAIRAVGFITPIVVDQADMILAGHARWQAAKLLGLTNLPTICAAGMPQEHLDLFVIADNKFSERAGWDRPKLAVYLEELQIKLEPLNMDLSLTGFEAAEIDLLLADVGPEAPGPEDVLPPAAGPVVSRGGDLWILRDHRIMCGDARSQADLQRLMSDRLADAVFTDPPYNVRISGHVQGRGKIKHREFACASGEMSDTEFRAFLSTCLSSAVMQSRDGAVHYVCMDWRHVDALIEQGRKIYGAFLNLVVWNKTTPGQGSFYRSQHELIAVFRVGGDRHQNNVELGKYGRNRSNVWTYPGVNSFGAGRDAALAMHPTVKPVALVADALRDCTAKGSLVLDPFLGSGTTLVAADKIGRRCYGLEVEPAYVDVAIRRWQALTHCDAILDGDGRAFDEIAEERSKGPVTPARRPPPDEAPSDLDPQAETWVALCSPLPGAAPSDSQASS